jgi:hypothetical protein
MLPTAIASATQAGKLTPAVKPWFPDDTTVVTPAPANAVIAMWVRLKLQGNAFSLGHCWLSPMLMFTSRTPSAAWFDTRKSRAASTSENQVNANWFITLTATMPT